MNVHVAFTKWGGGRHWEFDVERLGEDAHGVWLGGPTGLFMSRPGRDVVFEFPSVLLVPRGEPWAASFNADAPLPVRAGCDVYIDMTTPAVWSEDGSSVTMVDLDLDVYRRWDGVVVVDDEDEFAEHQVRYGYPDDTIAMAERSCAERRAALSAGQEPFDQDFRHWLALVD